MFINITQTYECSKCGSHSVEFFSDDTHQGIRCKKCSHEQKDLHLWLKESTGSVSWSRSANEVIKF